MSKTADALINELLALHPKGFDLSLERILHLLEKLDNPHLKLPPIIHIAGTNGKGSATAFTRALLEAAGYSVHVHTSPHLVNWHERYRIGHPDGGRLVEDAVLADALQRVADANNGQKITVFEILTAVAFVLFSEHPADAVILEVGLGGRFDATNVVVKPAVSVIMPISLDHQAFLGERLEDIAVEKAGIIKRHTPVIISRQESEVVEQLLIDIAWHYLAPSHIWGRDFNSYQEHGRMVFQNDSGLMDLPLPNLKGQFQIANAATAIEAVITAGFNINEQIAAKAMQTVFWPARMQKLDHGKLKDLLPDTAELWLDGGHNPAAGGIVADTLREMRNMDEVELYLVCGMINTKDTRGYFSGYKNLHPFVYTVPLQNHAAGIDPEELAKAANVIDLKTKPMPSVVAALEHISTSYQGDKPLLVVICGSLYLAGEVLAANETLPQ